MCQVHAFFISDYVGGAEKQDRTSDLVKLSKELQEEAGRERLMGKQTRGSECEGGL